MDCDQNDLYSHYIGWQYSHYDDVDLETIVFYEGCCIDVLPRIRGGVHVCISSQTLGKKRPGTGTGTSQAAKNATQYASMVPSPMRTVPNATRMERIDLANDRSARNKAVNDYSITVQDFLIKSTEDYLETVGRDVLGISHYWCRFEFAKGQGQIHAHIIAILKKEIMTDLQCRLN